MELICYLHEGWAPLIRPAPATRQWMDETPDAFAYRCLPMNIANAHGWEILTPGGFSAYWRGGSKIEDVLIKCDDGIPTIARPATVFGCGVLTFHIQGIFRTEPGWNLFVSGSPNWAKDGIAPLSGVIETDWAPYTFTMNWRFTRRNHWVRFEAGEPICFLFPVQRKVLEAVEPKMVPMAENPNLQQQFRAWSQSRDKFRADTVRNPPASKADTWQKTYYQGRDMNGRKGAPDHQAKLRLREFAAPQRS